MSAAAAQATTETAAATLAGIRADDVMTADPDIGGTWMTAAEFIDRTALTSAQTGLPVVAPGGSLAGATSVSKLACVPPASWTGLVTLPAAPPP